jgi:hypothetical protein
MFKPKSSRSSRCTHITNKPKILKNVCPKPYGNYFLGEIGVGMVELMQLWTKMMSEFYFEILKKLSRAIHDKRRGMLTYGVTLLHESARPHAAARTPVLLECLNWELFGHPAYSPDLAASEYHLFTYLKNWLESKRFNNDKDLFLRCQNVIEIAGGRFL